MTPTEAERKVADSICHQHSDCDHYCGREYCVGEIARALSDARQAGFNEGVEASAKLIDKELNNGMDWRKRTYLAHLIRSLIRKEAGSE